MLEMSVIIGSKTVGPADASSQFWAAFDRWRANENVDAPGRLYLDGRGPKVVATLLEGR
jgi:hypothetical protein